jgi:hypothetical protein
MSTKLMFTSLLALAIGVIGCMPKKYVSPHAISDCDASFFGDSTAVFMANTLQNGYKATYKLINDSLKLVETKVIE